MMVDHFGLVNLVARTRTKYYSTILAMITGGLVAMTAISFNGLLQEIQRDLVMR